MSLSFLARTCSHRAGRIPHRVSAVRLLRTESKNSDPSSSRIILTGVPELTTPSDIKRHLEGKVQGLVSVELEYDRFSPTGNALLTMLKPDYVQDNIRALRGFSICGHLIGAKVWTDPEPQLPRSRGAQGREEAAARGLISGTGFRGNYPNIKRSVVMWGLPGTVTVEAVETVYGDFKLARTKKGKAHIHKLPQLPRSMFTVHSRFVITLVSEEEAQRFARYVHDTECPFTGGQRINAQVLY